MIGKTVRPHPSPALGALLVLTVAALCGCSRLPDSAAPKLRNDVTHDMVEATDVISYRTLTRADFRAAEPPREFAAIASRLGAATCAHLLTAQRTRAVIVEGRSADGEREFGASLRDIAFRAVMDRTCSWWNDRLAALRPEYVLEHEQIHFAITELEARRLNASAAELVASARFRGRTQEAAFSQVELVVQQKLKEGSDAVLARSRDFDEDTSMGYEPARQREWLRIVAEELKATRAFAEP